MLKQHTHKQDAMRAEIDDATAKFLASGGKINVIDGFVERQNKVSVDYSFRAASNFTNIRPANQNPNWVNARSTYNLIVAYKIYQKDLAAAVGLKQGQLATYLHKRGNPTPELAKRIERALAEMLYQKELESE